MSQANPHRTKFFLFFAWCIVVLPSCGKEQAASVTTNSTSQSPKATYSVKTLGRYTFEPGALLFSADLKFADLVGVDLTGAVLSRSDLTGANLTGANLERADLRNANLTDANLTDANLTGAKLNGANLTGAKLNDANLTGANLFGANLTGANLTGAGLGSANLNDAKLTGAILDGAIGTPTTTASYDPTWIVVTPNDVYAAPFAQTVCDIMRTWRPPAETTSEDVARLKKAMSQLSKFVDESSPTYLNIEVSAAALIEYERKYPTDKKFPFSKGLSEIECDRWGFTPTNSKYGIDPETGNTKNNP